MRNQVCSLVWLRMHHISPRPLTMTRVGANGLRRTRNSFQVIRKSNPNSPEKSLAFLEDRAELGFRPVTCWVGHTGRPQADSFDAEVCCQEWLPPDWGLVAFSFFAKHL